MGETSKMLDVAMAAAAAVSAEAWLQKAHEDWGAAEVLLCASDQPPTPAEATKLKNFIASQVVAPVAKEIQQRLELIKQSTLNANSDAK